MEKKKENRKYTEKINEVTAEEYCELRQKSGMGKKNPERAATALSNSLITAGIYDGDKIIASGRIVGDGGITFCVSDIMVDADYRRQGLGKRIMGILNDWMDKNTYDDSYVTLIAVKPADNLYRQFSFREENDERVAMRRIQKK